MKQIIIFLSLFGTFAFSQVISENEKSSSIDISKEQQMAFKILQNKCNVCHRTQNPSKLFTLNNMNDFARKINRQVFVWKRMPKGKENNLTTIEKQTLKTWLNDQLNQN